MALPIEPASKSRLLPVAIYFLIGAVIAAGAFLTALSGRFESIAFSSSTLLSILAAFALGFNILWFGSRRRNFDPLEIVYPITAFYILNYPIRALFILFWPNYAVLSPYWPGESQMRYALNLSAAGMALFYTGYFLNSKGLPFNIFPRFSFKWTDDSINMKIFSLYGIGLLAWVALFLSGQGLRFQWVNEIGAFDYVWILLGNLRVWAIFLVWTRPATGRNASGLLAYSLLLAEVLLNLGIGSKQAVFGALIAVLFAFQYALKRTPWRLLMLAGLVFLFLFTPMIQIYRDTYAGILGYNPSPSLTDIGSVVQEFPRGLQQNADGWMMYSLTYLGNRAASLDTVTLLTGMVPRLLPYQSGQTLMLGVWGLIPRFIWPDKPILNMGMYATSVIFSSASISNTPLTDIGEFYLNFGLAGVLAGMFALGTLFRSVYLYCATLIGHDPILGAILYLSVFSTLLFAQTGVGSIVVALTRIVPLAILGEWLLSGTRKSQSGRVYG